MPTTNKPTNLLDPLATFEQLWSPRIVASVNDYDVRIAKVKGEYVWHSHENTDEFFMVLDGSFRIGLRTEGVEHEVVLGVGDVYVVPRGQQHRPGSDEGASVLMFEMSGTLTTGDYSGDIPTHIDSTSGRRLDPIPAAASSRYDQLVAEGVVHPPKEPRDIDEIMAQIRATQAPEKS